MSNATEVIEAFTPAQLAAKAVIQKQFIKLMSDELRKTTNLALEQFSKGSNEAARLVIDGEDTKLGKLSKSDPAKVATVVDYEKFEAHLRATYADKLEERNVLGELSEIIPVLLEHAPHLVDMQTDVIPDWLARNELELAKSTPIPGVEVRAPEGVMSITTTAAAETLVRSMLAASPIELLTLPAGAK
ncbi:hypothetical protein [Rhodococcus sp. MALMAid1271]|uniref:hypothetical protein n=1 Tax=Rhodococcus sp. MALMAid1271 TaxID=3411744 RepID=UPI003BA38F83